MREGQAALNWKPGDITGYLPSGAAIRQAVPMMPPEKKRKVMRFSQVEAEEPQFLFKPYFPMGTVTVVEGDPNAGKLRPGKYACVLP